MPFYCSGPARGSAVSRSTFLDASRHTVATSGRRHRLCPDHHQGDLKSFDSTTLHETWNALQRSLCSYGSRLRVLRRAVDRGVGMSMPSSPCSRFLKGCWKRSVFRQSALPSCLPHWKRRTSASRVRDASLHVSGRGPWNLRETAYGKVGGGALPTRRRWTVSFLEIVVVRTGVPPNPLPKLCRWLGRRLPDLNPQDIKKNTNTDVQHARQQRALHKNRTHQPPILRRMERQNVLGMYRAVRDSADVRRFFFTKFPFLCSSSACCGIVAIQRRHLSCSSHNTHVLAVVVWRDKNHAQGATRRAVAKGQAGHLQIIGEHVGSPDKWDMIGPMGPCWTKDRLCCGHRFEKGDAEVENTEMACELV